MDAEEDLILARIKKRDKEAFRYLYEYYFAKMVLFAESYLYDEEEARDLVAGSIFPLMESCRDITSGNLRESLFVHFGTKSLFECDSGSEDQG